MTDSQFNGEDMKKVIEKFFTQEFLQVTNVDGHKIVLRTSMITYIAEDVKNHMAYIHLSTGKTISVNLMNMPPLNKSGSTLYTNDEPLPPLRQNQ